MNEAVGKLSIMKKNILLAFSFYFMLGLSAQNIVNIPACNNCEAAIQTLNCLATTFSNTEFTTGQEFHSSMSIPYTGGNGQPVGDLMVSSTGVTGLTASLLAADLANGSGQLSFYIHGFPSGAGTASFDINYAGQNCTAELILSQAPNQGQGNDTGAINSDHMGYTQIYAAPFSGQSHYGVAIKDSQLILLGGVFLGTNTFPNINISTAENQIAIPPTGLPVITDHPVVKADTEAGDYMWLESDGKLKAIWFSLSLGFNAYFGPNHTANRFMEDVELPSGVSAVKDFAMSYMEGTHLALGEPSTVDNKWVKNPGITIVDENGDAWHYYRALGASSLGSWQAINDPLGVPAGFEYTKVWRGGNRVYLEGSDGNYYAVGRNFAGSLGIDNINGGLANGDVSLSDPVLVPFPAGTVIKKIDARTGVANGSAGLFMTSVVAIATNGKAYYAGPAHIARDIVNNGSPIEPVDAVPFIDDSNLHSHSSFAYNNGMYSTRFRELELPPNCTSFIDIEVGQNTLYAIAQGNDFVRVYTLGAYQLVHSGTTDFDSAPKDLLDRSGVYYPLAIDVSGTAQEPSITVTNTAAFIITGNGVVYSFGSPGRALGFLGTFTSPTPFHIPSLKPRATWWVNVSSN